jgi:hypothetical protein
MADENKVIIIGLVFVGLGAVGFLWWFEWAMNGGLS